MSCPCCSSLSIEEEGTGPGRYIGKLTVRFLPAKVARLFDSYGVTVVTEQAPPMLVLPVWKAPEGTELWEDNLWRKAWLGLNAEQSLVPIIIPFGDLEDTAAITAQECSISIRSSLNRCAAATAPAPYWWPLPNPPKATACTP